MTGSAMPATPLSSARCSPRCHSTSREGKPMPPRPEPLQPCRMIELTADPPRIDRERRGRFNDTRVGHEAPDHDRISSEVVVWTQAAPASVERSAPDTRVSVECIELGNRLDPRLTLL